MVRAKWLFTSISFGVVVTLSASAAAQTLRERARQSGGEPVVYGVLSEILPKSIEELTAESDVVVMAMLQKGKTTLTANEMYLYTPYSMSNIRVVAGALPTLLGALGKINPVTLIHGGGEMILEGVLVRSENHNLRDIEDGHYLLFLKQFRAEPGQYQIHNGGIFAIDSDTVRPVVGGFDEIFPGIKGSPISRLVSRIENARKLR